MTDDEALTLIESLLTLPKGARVTSATISFDYLNPDGRDCYGANHYGDSPVTNRIGLLQLSAMRLALHQFDADEEHAQDGDES